MVQHCLSCGLLRGAVGAACPFCTSLEWDWQPVSGKGVIYSYQIVTQAVHPAFADWVPYPIVLVELDEQRGVPWRGGARRRDGVAAGHGQPVPRATTPPCPRPRRTWPSASGSRCVSSNLDDSMAVPQFRLSDEPPEVTPWRAPIERTSA